LSRRVTPPATPAAALSAAIAAALKAVAAGFATFARVHVIVDLLSL
jgi:hypothetical protein